VIVSNVLSTHFYYGVHSCKIDTSLCQSSLVLSDHTSIWKVFEAFFVGPLCCLLMTLANLSLGKVEVMSVQ
jgi:hypothetical protein